MKYPFTLKWKNKTFWLSTGHCLSIQCGWSPWAIFERIPIPLSRPPPPPPFSSGSGPEFLMYLRFSLRQYSPSQVHAIIVGDDKCNLWFLNVVSDIKLIMTLISRVAFYPTLLYNVVLEKVSSRQWYNRIDDTVLLGALPFRSLTKQVHSQLHFSLTLWHHCSNMNALFTITAIVVPWNKGLEFLNV